eukprot:TRINITY_DN12374_c0_g2_i3.p1 TRINITY_DN12374_c0_g2~~TRINITY_DN12374_c0_g2_i3.p1  ORF type:complete len:748 (+),score=137.86 TRINITY_DN12374_c0_g2_i3:1-2244(+)
MSASALNICDYDGSGTMPRRASMIRMLTRPFVVADHADLTSKYEDFSTIDWARDTATELERKRTVLRAQPSWLKALDAASGWILMSLIGMSSGVAAGLIDIGAEWLSDIKEGYCRNAFWLSRKQCCWAEDASDLKHACSLWHDYNHDKHSYAAAYFIYMAYAILFAFICAILVKRLAPYAAGSGIPEVKTILSGFVMKGYSDGWKLVVKATGMVLAVAAGLSLGKEGPLVHVACCCGNLFCLLFEKYRTNEGKRREVLSAASAAGVSVAFGAPVGGILFSLEEVSYYFPHKTMWRAFFAALVAAVVLSNLNPFLSGKLVKFYVEFDYPWHWFELLPFAMLGIFGGLYGAAFNQANIVWCRLRKTSWLRKYPINEIIVVTFITALLAYPNELTRSSAADLIAKLFAECDPRDTTPICSWGQGSDIVGLLLLACLFKAATTIFTFGMRIPSGLFIPTMAVGATMGRVVGLLMERIIHDHPHSNYVSKVCPDIETCVTPGLYAMVGAAATLGGVTRMTVSLVVIMFELTGGLTYILPLMVGVMVSKWVGDAINPSGIYDRHIQLNGYPFLENKDPFEHPSIAKDVMQPGGSQGETPVFITMANCKLAQLEHLAEADEHSGYPLVQSDSNQVVAGYILRKDLLKALDVISEQDDITSATRVSFVKPDDTFAQAVEAPSQQGMIQLHHIVQKNVFQVADTTPMTTVVELFRRMGIKQAMVTRQAQLVGIISKKDVIRHIAFMEKRQVDVAFS